MPGWQAVSFDNPAVSVEAKPKSWRREGLFQLVPYLYGSKPQFQLTIAARENLVQPSELYWFLRFSSGDETGHQLLLPPMQKDQSINIDVGERLLGFTGDTILGVRTAYVARSYHTLYSFRTMAPEDLARDLLIGALLVALTFVLGLCNG